MIDTPDPMFTRRHGSCGVGLASNVTPNLGGSGLGLSKISFGFSGFELDAISAEAPSAFGKAALERRACVCLETWWTNSSEK